MAVTQEQREAAAQDRIRAFLEDLYGEEQALIVRNTTDGVVSIGFGELGDKGGKAIERSKLPIVLTDEFPRDTWIKSSDFRRAVAKGWLIPVSKAEYDRELSAQRERLAAAKREAAALDNGTPRVSDQRRPDPFSDDPTGEPMVIDEDSAELQPVSRDKRMKQFMEYETGQETVSRPAGNTPEGVTVIGGAVSSRAISFCEELKRGNFTSNQAIEWLDQEEKILTEDDLTYIVGHAEVSSVKSQARRLLAERS